MKDYKQEDKLRVLYKKYNSQKDVAKACGCSIPTIVKWMDKFDIETTDSHSNIRDRDFTPVEHKPNTICDYCSSNFWRKPSLKDGQNFCDESCYGEWLSENNSGENHQQYNRVTVNCQNCGDSKEIPPSEKQERNFCDAQCHAEYEDRSDKNNPFWSGGKETVECEYCGESKEVYPNRIKRSENFFCDVDCRGEWVTESFSGENHPLWEGYSENYGESWLSMRKKIRDRDNGECQICGSDKEELGQWPDVHHIKPVSKFDNPDEANFPSNLIMLCSVCHGKVEKGRIELATPSRLSEEQ